MKKFSIKENRNIYFSGVNQSNLEPIGPLENPEIKKDSEQLPDPIKLKQDIEARIDQSNVIINDLKNLKSKIKEPDRTLYFKQTFTKIEDGRGAMQMQEEEKNGGQKYFQEAKETYNKKINRLDKLIGQIQEAVDSVNDIKSKIYSTNPEDFNQAMSNLSKLIGAINSGNDYLIGPMEPEKQRIEKKETKNEDLKELENTRNNLQEVKNQLNQLSQDTEKLKEKLEKPNLMSQQKFEMLKLEYTVLINSTKSSANIIQSITENRQRPLKTLKKDLLDAQEEINKFKKDFENLTKTNSTREALDKWAKGGVGSRISFGIEELPNTKNKKEEPSVKTETPKVELTPVAESKPNVEEVKDETIQSPVEVKQPVAKPEPEVVEVKVESRQSPVEEEQKVTEAESDAVEEIPFVDSVKKEIKEKKKVNNLTPTPTPTPTREVASDIVISDQDIKEIDESISKIKEAKTKVKDVEEITTSQEEVSAEEIVAKLQENSSTEIPKEFQNSFELIGNELMYKINIVENKTTITKDIKLFSIEDTDLKFSKYNGNLFIILNGTPLSMIKESIDSDKIQVTVSLEDNKTNLELNLDYKGNGIKKTKNKKEYYISGEIVSQSDYINSTDSFIADKVVKPYEIDYKNIDEIIAAYEIIVKNSPSQKIYAQRRIDNLEERKKEGKGPKDYEIDNLIKFAERAKLLKETPQGFSKEIPEEFISDIAVFEGNVYLLTGSSIPLLTENNPNIFFNSQDSNSLDIWVKGEITHLEVYKSIQDEGNLDGYSIEASKDGQVLYEMQIRPNGTGKKIEGEKITYYVKGGESNKEQYLTEIEKISNKESILAKAGINIDYTKNIIEFNYKDKKIRINPNDLLDLSLIDEIKSKKSSEEMQKLCADTFEQISLEKLKEKGILITIETGNINYQSSNNDQISFNQNELDDSKFIENLIKNSDSTVQELEGKIFTQYDQALLNRSLALEEKEKLDILKAEVINELSDIAPKEVAENEFNFEKNQRVHEAANIFLKRVVDKKTELPQNYRDIIKENFELEYGEILQKEIEKTYAKSLEEINKILKSDLTFEEKESKIQEIKKIALQSVEPMKLLAKNTTSEKLLELSNTDKAEEIIKQREENEKIARKESIKENFNSMIYFTEDLETQPEKDIFKSILKSCLVSNGKPVQSLGLHSRIKRSLIESPEIQEINNIYKEIQSQIDNINDESISNLEEKIARYNKLRNQITNPEGIIIENLIAEYKESIDRRPKYTEDLAKKGIFIDETALGGLNYVNYGDYKHIKIDYPDLDKLIEYRNEPTKLAQFLDNLEPVLTAKAEEKKIADKKAEDKKAAEDFIKNGII